METFGEGDWRYSSTRFNLGVRLQSLYCQCNKDWYPSNILLTALAADKILTFRPYRKWSRDLLAVLVTISTEWRLHVTFAALGLAMTISSRHVKSDMDSKRNWPYQLGTKNVLGCRLKHIQALSSGQYELCTETSHWLYFRSSDDVFVQKMISRCYKVKIINFSQTSVTTRRHIQEDSNLHCHRPEHLK